MLLVFIFCVNGKADTVPFIEPDDGTAPLVAAFDEAKQSVDTYIFRLRDNETFVVRPIVDALGSAVARGVRVRALLESCPSGDLEQCVAPNRDARSACNLLLERNVEVKWANPAFTKTHAKPAVIDGSKALIMTLNLVHQTFTRDASRRDYGVVTTDSKVIEDLNRVFAQDWGDDEPITNCSLPPQRDPNGATQSYSALVVSPDNGRDRLLGTEAMPGLIRSAQHELKIQMEKIDPQSSHGVWPVLRDRIRAGVQVLVLLHPPTDREHASNEEVADRINLEGGEARFQTDLHAKMMIVDGQLVYLGSHNLTRASLDARREIGWITDDSATRDLFDQTFTSDWQTAQTAR